MRLPRVTITTLGQASSGETVWATSIYRMLRSPELQTQLPPGRLVHSDACDEYEIIDTRLRESRIWASATCRGRLQTPLVYHVVRRDHRDGDFLVLVVAPCVGAKGCLFFDVCDPMVERQLRTNGLVWFVDPTLDDPKYHSECLSRLSTCLSTMRNKMPEQPWIAICLTKIDWLLAQNRNVGTDQRLSSETSAEYDQVQEWKAISRDLGQIQRFTVAGSMQRINACSQWTRRVCRLLWAQWECDIEEQLRAICGDRFEFFPVSAVGITDLGRADLNTCSLEGRTIEPFGVLEPVFWLIHVNGYPVWQTS